MTTGPGEAEQRYGYFVTPSTFSDGLIKRVICYKVGRGRWIFRERGMPKRGFVTEDEAADAANTVRHKRIAVLKKRIARLQELQFRIA